MSEDKRLYPRTPFKCRVKLTHEFIGETTVNSRNISDGGLFLVMDGQPVPPLGTIVQGQVQGMSADAPVLSMEIVRIETSGIGLRFIDSED